MNDLTDLNDRNLRRTGSLRISPGTAAREHERAQDRDAPAPGSGYRIPGGTAARKAEGEAREAVVRSPYGMRISARVGKPFTFEEERSAHGERLPETAAGEVVALADVPNENHSQDLRQMGQVSVDREVVLTALPRATQSHASVPQDSPTLPSGSNGVADRLYAGVSSLKALLPRSWFRSQPVVEAQPQVRRPESSNPSRLP